MSDETKEPQKPIWINVRDFGAAGEGAPDDRAAIQAAINACVAAGGGVVYFPEGTY
jgi:polygalacturonase